VHKQDIAQQSVGTQELAGTLTAGAIPAGRIGAGTCSAAVDVAVTPAPPADDATGVLDDVVIGGRSKDWPADLSLRVQPVGPGTVRAYACHTQPGDDDVTLGAPLPFTVLTITA
jgi:hypothetical protein